MRSRLLGDGCPGASSGGTGTGHDPRRARRRRAGGRDAGPLGAVVGGAIGAANGTVGGILGVDDRPRFREYVVRQRVPSYHYDEGRPGWRSTARERVTYYEVPPEYHVRGYRYTYVNEHPVSVDPHTRGIVQIID
jgi:hypothetical protein